MPSPFPGMDPYIEAPEIWSDFHGDIAPEIRSRLNQVIRPRYVARLNPHVTYEIIEIAELRTIRPDVGIWSQQATLDPALTTTRVITPAPVEGVIPFEVPLRLQTVEVREIATLELVTAIEILSPVNKRPGHEAYRNYLRKRRELLRSEVHLLEIDLLRGGERPPLETPVPTAPYYATLSRVQRRPKVAVWPIQLQDTLPVLPVPLLYPDDDAALDLGACVAAIYERAAYAQLIDYRRPPPPPKLSELESLWLNAHLRQQGLR